MQLHYPLSRGLSNRCCAIALCIALSLQAYAQSRTVTGTVQDSDGNLLPGVSIFEKGTTNGTTSDGDGRYSLTVGNDAVLVYSFIGMVTREIPVGTQTTINVVMESDVSQLDEVVVIGYGTTKKSDLTGSVVSVSGEDLRKMPVATVAETLTGRLAGVQVTTTEGSPDADIHIRVRGGTSISQDNSPLYIVDGFPISSISDISPTDIESISVLKDASSTAIYGSRGANGVVIITTRGGSKDGRLTVNFNAFGGVKKLANHLDVLSPYDYAMLQYEHAVRRENLASYEDYFGAFQDMDLYAGLQGNNWQKIVYGRRGEVQSGDLSVRGGTEKFSYSLNYARFQDKAIMVGSDYTRDNVTMRLDNKPNDKVDIAFSLRYARTEVNGGGANEQNEVSSADSRLKHSVGYSPIPVAGLTTDDTNEQTATDLTNPLIATADNDRNQVRRNYNMNGSFGWQITPNLRLKTDVGLDNYDRSDHRFYGLTTYYVRNIPSSENQNFPAAVMRDRKETRLRNTNTLVYDFKEMLGTDHRLSILAGHEMLKTQVVENTAAIHGFPKLFTSGEAFKLTTQGSPQSVNNHISPDNKLLSFFGRANYDFMDRYLLSATYRADGSSKFMGKNRWGYFPSAAVAWKLSEESFMAGIGPWMNLLKLRISYGEAGNENIPTGQTVQSFVSSTSAWINGFDSFWAPSKTMANPDLKWETTVTRNLGLDFELFSGKLSGAVEAYHNSTRDLLLLYNIPGTGYTDQYRNMGETENRGIEFSFTYYALEREHYGLNISANISFNRNKIVSIGDMEYVNGTSNWASTAIGPDYRVLPGLPLGLMYGYVHDGRYEISDFEGYDPSGDWILKSGIADVSAVVRDPAPGVMKLADLNGDGVVNADDKQVIGDVNAKHVGGITLNGYAYGFDLTASFNWSYGNDVYNANKIEYTTSTPQTQYRNLIDMMASGKRWTDIDPATGQMVTDPAQLQALNAGATMWSPFMDRFVFSDWAVEDGSFLRLNTLTLGYTMPEAISSKLGLRNFRVYATGYNVFLWTNYSGFDPEVSTRRSTPYTPGVDYSAYPRSRQIVFGLNVNF